MAWTKARTKNSIKCRTTSCNRGAVRGVLTAPLILSILADRGLVEEYRKVRGKMGKDVRELMLLEGLSYQDVAECLGRTLWATRWMIDSSSREITLGEIVLLAACLNRTVRILFV